jgi:hypothetical protein
VAQSSLGMPRPEIGTRGVGGLRICDWWARQDLNLGPMDYESTALTAELRALSSLGCIATGIRVNALVAPHRRDRTPSQTGYTETSTGSINVDQAEC